ncbi:hypothetical protein ACFL3U_05980 [Pseudomonadota bacterium]
MKQSQLILSQTPSFSVPLRFFMTAPLFGVAAALLMLFLEGSQFASRWSGGMLAYTHLLVLGYLAMVMQAALLQVVSVLTGGQPRQVGLLAVVMHVALIAGTLLLALGFLTGVTHFMHTAVLLLVLSFALFIGAVISGLLKSTARRDAGFGIGLALVCLMITVGLGAWLAVGHSVQGVVLVRHLTDIHLGWGLVGWGAILLITVAYAVVPMFQLTPVYPSTIMRYLTPVIVIGLVAWAGGDVFNLQLLSLVGRFIVAAGLVLFAVITLWLQSKRKKKSASEVTLWFWRCAMLNLLAVVIIWLAAQVFPELSKHPVYPLLLGVLVIHGFLISAVNGMLYKILPFLTWLHLSIKVTEHKLSRRLIPNIRKLLPDNRAHIQFWMHLLMLLLMVAATWQPGWFLLPAGVVFAASNLLLWLNLMEVLKIYKETGKKITEAAKEKIAVASPTAQPT